MIDRLYILAMIALVCCGMIGLLWVSKAMAAEWPVQYSWLYPQPVPEHVRFALFVRPCDSCPHEAAEQTRALAVTQSHDYARLQHDAYVVVRDTRSGAEIARLTVAQTRLDARLLPALRECRVGGPCPGPSAMRDVLRQDRERAGESVRPRAEPRVMP